LILSRDGLVLGTFPDGDESLAKPAWLKFVTLGEAERSFVEFGDQVWAFVKRGPYAAFSVADGGTRPGILVDQMEQVLLAAEDGRAKRGDTLRVPDATSAPSGKPRTSLHPTADKPLPSEIAAAGPGSPTKATADSPGQGHWRRTPSDEASEPTPADTDDAEDDALLTASEAPGGPDLTSPATPVSSLKKEPQKLVSSGPNDDFDEEAEVDRVLLAKEFSGLLQMDSDGDEEKA
jgi:hypothetical protein